MKSKFTKDNFIVIKNAIEPKVAEFVFNYFLMKHFTNFLNFK